MQSDDTWAVAAVDDLIRRCLLAIAENFARLALVQKATKEAGK